MSLLSVYSVVLASILSDGLSDADLQRFLPTLEQLDATRPGTQLIYQISGPPSPTPLGRNVLIYFYSKGCDCYIKEQNETYCSELWKEGMTLRWRYSEGSKFHCFHAGLVNEELSLAKIV